MHEMVPPTCISTGTKTYYTDKNGKTYLSSAGVKEVGADELIIPVSPDNHVGGDYAHSSSEHWIVCACGAELYHGEHIFDGKDVCTVCGFVKISPESESEREETDEAPQIKNESEGEETDEAPQIKDARFPWWMLIIAAAVICVVILVIILLVKKKGTPSHDTADHDGPAGSDGASDAQKNEEDTDSPKTE